MEMMLLSEMGNINWCLERCALSGCFLLYSCCLDLKISPEHALPGQAVPGAGAGSALGRPSDRSQESLSSLHSDLLSPRPTFILLVGGVSTVFCFIGLREVMCHSLHSFSQFLNFLSILLLTEFLSCFWDMEGTWCFPHFGDKINKARAER